MINKMNERRKWKNVNNEEGRRNYRRLRNELKRATEKAKKEYLLSRKYKATYVLVMWESFGTRLL
jgi:hypothetical protein